MDDPYWNAFFRLMITSAGMSRVSAIFLKMCFLNKSVELLIFRITGILRPISTNSLDKKGCHTSTPRQLQVDSISSTSSYSISSFSLIVFMIVSSPYLKSSLNELYPQNISSHPLADMIVVILLSNANFETK